MFQVKAQLAGNGSSFSKASTSLRGKPVNDLRLLNIVDENDNC